MITDRQRLEAIWEGATNDQSPLARHMAEAGQPKDFEEFITVLDAVIKAAEPVKVEDTHLVPIQTLVGNDEQAIINVERVPK